MPVVRQGGSASSLLGSRVAFVRNSEPKFASAKMKIKQELAAVISACDEEGGGTDPL